MRPYRGIPIGGKDFVYGWYWYNDATGKHYIRQTNFQPAEYDYTDYEVIPETVGQQTGRKVKDGTEIYEGDIIVFNIKQVGIWPGQEKPHEVKYPFVCGNANLGEVIGNIHQHPKLLEKDDG